MYKFNPFTFKLDVISNTSGFSNKALDNLASVAINTSLISDTDSTDDLGSSAKYWANGYIDKIYLNSTASLDGATAAELIDATGSIRVPLGASFWVGDYTETNSRVRIHHNSANGYIDYSTGALYFRNGNTAVLTLSSTNTVQIDGALTMNGTIASDTDSTDDLGTSSIYWANAYTDKLYLNSTATLDGATAGKINVVGGLLHADNISTYWGTGVDASIYYDGTNLVVNPKLVGTGVLNVLGNIAVSGTQVVGARVVDARADDVVDSTYGAEEAGVLDAVRDCLIQHGLMAAA